jgi:hypothetical protein
MPLENLFFLFQKESEGISEGEFQGIDCEGVSIPAFAKLAAVATSESLSRIKTSSPLDNKV